MGGRLESEASKIRERHSAFLNIPIKGAGQLREKLKWSYGAYHSTYGPSVSDAKGYYLFSVLNEVEKAGMSMMQASDFIVESSVEDVPDGLDDEDQRIADNVLQSRIDELTLWQRKMTEMMVDLVGFRSANNQDYYRHYLILHELASLRRTQKDIAEYYGAVNANYAHQEARLAQDADALTSKLTPEKCWYAVVRRGRITHPLRPFEGRFKAVFPNLKAAQKVILRTHNISFGSQSSSLHPGSSAGSRGLKLKDVDEQLVMLGLLTLHVIVAAKDLMNIHNTTGILKACADLVKKNDFPIALHKSRTSPDIEMGDFVVVEGHLAQVKKVIRSKYGYKSFRIRYLDMPQIPEIKEDVFIGELVSLFYKNRQATEEVKKMILEQTPGIEPTTQQLNRSMRESVKHLWSIGLKEITLGQPDEGYKKMGEYLEQQKSQTSNKNT